MSTQTHVDRLKELGRKILDTNGKCNSLSSQKLKTDCEKVGLKMLSPVSDILIENYTVNLDYFTSLNINEKRQFILNNMNLFNENPNLKIVKNNFDIQSLNNDENLINVSNMISDLDDDEIKAIYILISILTDNNYNLTDFFIKQIYELIMNIIQNNNKINFLDIQYGGKWTFLDILVRICAVIAILLDDSTNSTNRHGYGYSYSYGYGYRRRPRGLFN